jgi:uncharacterized protein (TIRG00374 family)
VGYVAAVTAERQQRRAPLTPEEEHALEELAEARIEDEERRRRPFTRGQLIRWVLLLTLVVLSLYVLGPGLIDVFSSAPQLAEIAWWWFPLMLLLEAGSYGALWAVQWISIRSAAWWNIATSQLAGNAFGRIIPGGGATAGALQYRMLVDAGTPGGGAATGLTASNLLTFGVLLGLPVLTVPAIIDGISVDRSIQRMLGFALMMLLALAIGTVVLTVTDKPLLWVGRQVQAIHNRLARRRPPIEGLPERLIRERDLIIDVVGERWKRALLASVAKWMLDYGVLVVALAGVHNHTRLSLILLAYFVAQLLAQIPITPGGLGFVEAGLTGTLALVGVAAGDAVVATLAYRLVSYWLPIPLGGVAYWLFRRRYPGSVTADPAPA